MRSESCQRCGRTLSRKESSGTLIGGYCDGCAAGLANELANKERAVVPQAEQFRHEMVFVKREGNQPLGGMWAAFLEEQQRILDDYGSRGWQLVATVPVLKVTLEGVLLYFTSRPRLGTETRRTV